VETFSAPHNWCDRRCERCPLEPSCPVPKRDDGRSLEAIVHETIAIIERFAESEGIDLLAPPSHRVAPPSLSALRLRRAGDRVIEIAASSTSAAATAALVAGKLVRLACAIEDLDVDPDLWIFDGAPNLLLLETLLTELPAELAAIVRGAIAPYRSLVPDQLRKAFTQIVDGGLAPSPFAIRTSGVP
jgi:hypothetical protein